VGTTLKKLVGALYEHRKQIGNEVVEYENRARSENAGLVGRASEVAVWITKKPRGIDDLTNDSREE
jgi:hypothetical protein